MGRFLSGAAEEGVEEGRFSNVRAPEEGDFGKGGRWEGAEVGCGEEDVGWLSGEEGAGMPQFGG